MKKQNLLQSCRRVAVLVILPLLMTILGIMTVAQPTFADGVPEYRLQISPTQNRIETLQPGETYEGEFKIQNSGSKAYSYKTSIAPFSVTGSNYEQNFENTSQYTEITDWVTITEGKQGEIQPNEQQVVKYKIKVPKDAPGRSQSAAIIVTMDAGEAEGGIQTVKQIGYYFYANIGGETKRSAEIIANKIPSFIFNPPLVVSSTVKNTGNIYTNAKYRLEVYNLFGGKMVYSNATDSEDGGEQVDSRVIFPETERYNEVSWDNAPQLGIFKVKQTVEIFNEKSEVEKIVFICPIWFLLIIIVIIAIIVYQIVSRILRRRASR